MEIPEHRRWMYNRKNPQGNKLLDAFIQGVEEFILAASELHVFKREGTFRCPCLKCKCTRFHEPNEVRKHLYRKGFQPYYYYWHNHGEIEPEILRRGYEVDPISNYLNPYKTRELGREVTIPELFCKVNHNDEMNQSSTPRAARTYSSFEKLKNDVAASKTPVDDSVLFFQATRGKNKRGRAYKFGSEIAFYSSSESGSNRSKSKLATTAPNTNELTQLQQRIAVLETQLEEQQRNQGDRIAQLEAELNTLRVSVDRVATLETQLQSQRQSDLRVSQLESELATLKECFEQFTSHMHYGHNNSEAAPTTSLRPPTINEDGEDNEELGDDSENF